jgi:hypothetical protein
MTSVKHLISLPVVVAALAAVGCGESTSPGAADPTALVPVLNSVDASFSQNAVFQSLAALSANVVFSAPVVPAPAAERGASRALTAARRSLMLMRRLGDRAPAAITALFPVNVLGKTFMWDTAAGGRYRIVDSTTTGAPAAGTRFILYQVDTATGLPRLPLATTGNVDLTDVSSPQADALAIKVHVGSQTAADYTIANVRTTTTDTLRAAGSVVDVVSGGLPVTFTLSHALSLSDSSLVTNYVATSNGAAVAMNTTITGAANNQSLTLDWLIRKGGWVEVVGTSTPATTNVQFKVNGSVWATATAAAGGTPSITGANGRALTAPELVALGAILEGFFSVYEQLTAVFGPAALVFS